MSKTFVWKSKIPASAETVFDWHKQPDAFKKLIPPWEKVELVGMTGPISQEGSLVTLRMTVLGPIQATWVSRHHDYVEGREFRDTQIKGPFWAWEHTHRVIPETEQSCWLEDSIVYTVPFGFLGEWFGGWFVQRKLEKMFRFRHAVVLKECQG